MLRPTAVHVEATCAYQILVVFDNGEKSALMSNHISMANGMENYGLLNILSVFPQMALLLCGSMGRIYVQMNIVLFRKISIIELKTCKPACDMQGYKNGN